MTDIDPMFEQTVPSERSRFVHPGDRSEAAPVPPLRILHVADDENDHHAMVELLANIDRFDHELDWVTSDQAGFDAAVTGKHDVCLVDHRLGQRRGLQFVSEPGPSRSPIILLVDPDDEQIGVEALRAGAADYLVKGRMDVETVGRAILHTVERAHLLSEVRELRGAIESATSAKSRFLANMSDEIRTPLSAIVRMTDLALATRPTPEQLEYLGTIEASTQALLTSVNDLFDLSKIEAGDLRLDAIPFRLRVAVEGALGTLTRQAADKGLDLSYEIPDTVVDRVAGDPGRLRQVLSNVVGNAIKFTPAGGIALRVETESATDDHIVLHFRVRDTGIGIPEDKQEAIFEPFAQADDSMTRRYCGIGAGLAVASWIIRRMGGRLWVESKLGEGSTFHFTVPLAIQQREEATQPTLDAVRLTELGVLALADSADQRRNLSALLRQAGMDPFTVGDLSLALAAADYATASGETIDVAVIDIQDRAFDTCRHIIKSASFNGVPVIVLAASGHRGDAARYRELGATGYLTKPVSQRELVDAIRACVALARSDNRSTLVTRYWLRERRRPLHVLLVADNPINRRVVRGLLERHGLSFVEVENGRAAVKRWKQEHFDLILMDVQMPEMDGLEATAVIRAHEDQEGGHTPILGLNPSTGNDLPRCLEAGMDACLSKPYQADELLATIDQLVLPPANNASHNRHAAPTPTVLDRQEALERVDGIPQLLSNMIELFLDEYPSRCEGIEQALLDGDLGTVSGVAQSIKGALGNMAAHDTRTAAHRLEATARDGDLEASRRAWSDLQREIARLEPELLSLASDGIARSN